jgi:mRNA interferase MazF
MVNRSRLSDFIPDRGDIVWITLNPESGHEQSGRRPAVVLSPRSYNGKVGLAFMCPLTTAIKGYPWEVQVPPDLPVSGVVLSDQVRSLDWRIRKAERICLLPTETVTEILGKLSVLLAF